MQYRYGLVAVFLASIHIGAQSPHWQNVDDDNPIKQKCLQSNGTNAFCNEIEQFFADVAKQAKNAHPEYKQIRAQTAGKPITMKSLVNSDLKKIEFFAKQLEAISKIIPQRIQNLQDESVVEIGAIAPLFIAATAMGTTEFEREAIASQLFGILMMVQQEQEAPAMQAAHVPTHRPSSSHRRKPSGSRPNGKFDH